MEGDVPGPAIQVEDLGYAYGERVAVAGISFQVARGKILGFLGPNGAGKSTTIKMLTGQLTPRTGRALILGREVHRDGGDVHSFQSHRPNEVREVSMDTTTAILQRRAIRKYKPDQVPDDLLREILAEARWAPSATNTQSTNVYVLQGEPFQRFKSELRQYAESEVEPNPDFAPGAGLPPALLARQQALFQTRMSFIAAEEAKLGIEPTAPPVNPGVAMADIFGAPTALVLTFEEGVSEAYGCFDGGLFAMALCLAAQSRGLGTCITGSNVRYPDLLRKVLPGTEKQKILMLIAIGYPDHDAPVNRFPRTRIPVDEFVTFVR